MTEDDDAAPMDDLRDRLLGGEDDTGREDATERAESVDADENWGETSPDRGESTADRGESTADRGDRSGDDRADAPLSDLARDVERRRESRTAAGDDLFAEMATDDLDSDAVWDAVSEDDASSDGPSRPGAVTDADGTDATRVESSRAADEHVVEKRSYCQQCEYFSSPPTVACGHAGTEIVEVVDADRFRVRNCPLVDADARGVRFE